MLATSDRTVTEKDFRRVSQAVQEHCGINLRDGKLELVQARLAKLLRTRNFETTEAYLDHVLNDPGSAEFAHLIDSLSTNLTSFFRESQHFTYLGETFLPALITRKQTRNESTIRGWCAASSTGEEPYTLAMILLDVLQKQAVDFNARILATDISHRVLHVARQGIYDRQRVAPVPPAMRARYFTSRNGALEVVAAVRNIVRFAHLNLVKPWPLNGPLDFIFCRNVMIYFDKPTQQQLVNRFHDILSPGGLLFTGHCESLTGITHSFRHVQATIYQKL